MTADLTDGKVSEGSAASADRTRKTTFPRTLMRIVGGISALSGLLGLAYNGVTLKVESQGAFSNLVQQIPAPGFDAAFYAMSGICIACYLVLVACGIGLLRARSSWSRPLTLVLLFEVIYFATVRVLWYLAPNGMSIAAATGVANGGLTFQFIILFPIWGPLTLLWANKRLGEVPAGAVEEARPVAEPAAP